MLTTTTHSTTPDPSERDKSMDIDLSIPEGAPVEVVNALVALREELEEGDITAKGYRKHRDQLMSQWIEQIETQSTKPPESIISHHRKSSVVSYQASETASMRHHAPASPDAGYLQGLPPLQAPILPRGVPDTARSDPLNRNIRLTNFDNLPSILRHRAKSNADFPAFTLLGEKGKEVQSITWGRLASRSERVAQELRERSGLFRGDRVVLLYVESEPFEFIVAMMGCFLAGLVAVPFQPEYLGALPKILFSTQCHLVLTSDQTFKRIKNHQALQQLANITWWKTSDWEKYKKSELPALQVPDLAYIDYGISPVGEFRGVVMSHRTILHQMSCLTAVYQSQDSREGRGKTAQDKLICSLDIRRSTGLIFGVLHTIYAGNQAFFIPKRVMVVPGLYAHIISKYRTTVLLSDSSSLKEVCYNYQSNPDATRNFKKHTRVDLSSVRSAFVDAHQVDTEFLIALADRWLSPLGNRHGRDIVSPMLTLTEHGGMVIAMRDCITADSSHGPNDLRTIWLDREALKSNKVIMSQTSNTAEALSLGPFGYPLADSTISIVDPETRILCREDEIGEIWIDSPSISGGFWGLAEDTDMTFHAHCYDRNGRLQMDFLRTGILGFVYNGEVYMMGLLEDRLLQAADDIPADDLEENFIQRPLEITYYYASHLAYTIATSVAKVKEACLFQIPVGNRVLSYAIVETPLAKPIMYNSIPGKETERDMMLDEMCLQVISVLKSVHRFSVYCVIATAPNVTPRIRRSGEPEIAKLMARKYVKNGQLQALHVKYSVKDTIKGLPHGQDPDGGIWSPSISYIRSDSLGQDQDLQYSGVDMRNNVLDDRSGTPMDSFPSIMHIFQYRVKRQPDELAYLSLFMRAHENNVERTWSKLDMQVAAVYQYLKEHLHATFGQTAILMYTHSEQFVSAVLACFLLGVTVIPINAINTERLDEDMPSLLKVQRQYKVSMLLGNHETHAIMESKPVTNYIRSKSFPIMKLHNTAKVKIRAGMSCKNSLPNEKCLDKNFPALVWLNYTADHDFIASQMSHASILGMCKIQKETCQMTSTRPIIGCVRSMLGIGFLYTCCLGIYVGSSTILISPVDYANNPSSFFLTASRYKVKDVYATVKMLDHACKVIKPKGYSLNELQNLLVTSEGRADTEIVNQMRLVFGSTGLETIAINMSYGCAGNPVITTRSYMQLEPIDLWLDPVALRQGYVLVVNKWNCPNALHIQDSGMVTVNTQVAIVNPETRMLCRAGEFGEIWVLSDGNQSKYYQADDRVNEDVMRGTIEEGDPEVEYMRTGDFGFLHSITKGADGELQVLFVLGAIGSTVELNGLQHFVIDVEKTVEQSHSHILKAVLFTIGDGMSVICVETDLPKERLPGLSSTVVNTILEEHEFMVTIVLFVGTKGIPRSRLGEKQRKKLINLYVSGKLALISQFGIVAQS